MKKHHVIDYDTFLPRLVSGLRQAWEKVRRQRPGETFYTYGIATDSDVVVMTPFWNTEEEYARTGDPAYPVAKWAVPEHGYAPCKYTSALQDEINRYVFEDHRDDAEGVFEKRKARLLKIFEQGLVELDEEGFFGKGKERHRVLLQIDRGDCDDAEARWMLGVVKRINPGASCAPYFAALKNQQKFDAERERGKQQGEKPIKDLAIEFLRREKKKFDSFMHVHQFDTVTPFLLKMFGQKTAPAQLWEVCFNARGEPDGRLHGPGVLIVLVDPQSGRCVIAP